MPNELVYKLIVTALLDNLSEEDFIARVTNIIKGHTENPTIVPGLSPTTGAETTKLNDLKDLIVKRAYIIQQQKSITGEIKGAIKSIKNDIIDDWVKQVQKAVAGDTDLVKLLGYGIQGQDNLQAPPEYTCENSHAVIEKIDKNSSLKHKLLIKNNMTGKIGLPKDAKDIEVYMSIGTEEPVDYKKMTYLGHASRGRYLVEFTPDQVGLTVWYFVIYTTRKKGSPCETAGKVRAQVV